MSTIVSFLLFFNNCLFLHSQETNIWNERQKFLTAQITNLPKIETTILKNSKNKNLTITGETIDLSAYGRINKYLNPRASQPTTGQMVIHIQDVHMNLEAQKNIGALIQALVKNGKVDFIGLEGGFGPINLHPFQQFPRRETVNKIANYLFRENKISGPIRALMTLTPQNVSTFKNNPPLVIGIDDKKHYIAHVKAYQLAKHKQNDININLAQIKASFENEKAGIFNSELAKFDVVVEKYRSQRISMGDYLSYLSKNMPSQRMMAHINIFLQARHIESYLNFEQVEREQTRLLSQLTPRLTKDETNELLEFAKAFKQLKISRTHFYQYTENLCTKHGFEIKKFPALKDYITYILHSESIDSDELMREMNLAEKNSYESLVKTPQEKWHVDKCRKLYLIKKLINFELTKREWEEYQAIEQRPQAPILNEEKKLLEPFENFYHEAEIRDQKMANNFLKNVLKKPSTPSISILVTGGFHSTGIEKKLIDAGYTVIQFTPKITKIDIGKGTSYLSVFSQEKTPLDKLFHGDKLFLSPPIATSLPGGAILGAALEHKNSNKTLRALNPHTLDTAEDISTRNNPFSIKLSGPQGSKEISLKVSHGEIVEVEIKHIRFPPSHLLKLGLRILLSSILSPLSLVYVLVRQYADPNSKWRRGIIVIGGFFEEFITRWLILTFAFPLLFGILSPWVTVFVYASLFATVLHPKIFIGKNISSEWGWFIPQRLILFLLAIGIGIGGMGFAYFFPSSSYIFMGFLHAIYNLIAQKRGWVLGFAGDISLLKKKKPANAATVKDYNVDIKTIKTTMATAGEKLTKTEEKDLFHALRAKNLPPMDHMLLRNFLVEKYTYFVMFLAKQSNRRDKEEAAADGVIGLMKAIDKFDSQLGYVFITYAKDWIIESMRQGYRKEKTIWIPQYLDKELNLLEKIKKQLRNQLNREPTNDEIAEKMGLSVEKVQQLRSIPLKTNSLDAGFEEIQKGSEIHMTDQEEVLKVLSALTPRDQIILKLRFGIGTKNGETYTLEAIGKLLNLTKERIRKIIADGYSTASEETSTFQHPVSADDTDVFIVENFKIWPGNQLYERLLAKGRIELEKKAPHIIKGSQKTTLLRQENTILAREKKPSAIQIKKQKTKKLADSENSDMVKANQHRLKELQSSHSDVLYRHFIKGSALREIAEEKGVTPPAIRSMLSTALKRLKKLIQSDEPSDRQFVLTHLKRLDELKPSHAEVLYLRFVEEKTLQFIADKKKVSNKTIKSREFIGLKNLRKLVDSNEDSNAQFVKTHLAVVNKLKTSYRDILKDHFIAKKSLKKMAAKRGITVEALRDQLSNALKQLNKLIKPNEISDHDLVRSNEHRLKELKPLYQKVLLERFIEEKTQKQIAENENVSQANISKRQTYAIAELRKLIKSDNKPSDKKTVQTYQHQLEKLLGHRYAKILYDYFILNKTQQEIASDLGITQSNISKYQSKALEKLRRLTHSKNPQALSIFNPLSIIYTWMGKNTQSESKWLNRITAVGGFLEDSLGRWIIFSFVLPVFLGTISHWEAVFIYAGLFATLIHPKLFIGKNTSSQWGWFISQRIKLLLLAIGIGAGGMAFTYFLPFFLPSLSPELTVTLSYIFMGALHSAYNFFTRKQAFPPTIELPMNMINENSDSLELILEQLEGQIPTSLDIAHAFDGTSGSLSIVHINTKEDVLDLNSMLKLKKISKKQDLILIVSEKTEKDVVNIMKKYNRKKHMVIVPINNLKKNKMTGLYSYNEVLTNPNAAKLKTVRELQNNHFKTGQITVISRQPVIFEASERLAKIISLIIHRRDGWIRFQLNIFLNSFKRVEENA
ncbi:MAG: sigma-70 family RNA polymerase sigma factor [Elusimicrobiota bacterium]